MHDHDVRIDEMRLRVSGIGVDSAPGFARAVYEQLASRFSRVNGEKVLGALHLRVPAHRGADTNQLAASVADGIVKGIE
jgi:hypothetical protein